MIIDVTDATFEAEVVNRSNETPVVVDLWAPWCGPCRQLGPLLERTIAATDGKVVLAKVNVDENPSVAAAFRVQGIPAVYALADGKVVNGFVGAQGEAFVQEFVAELLPTEEESAIDTLIAAGDEASLREALELDPGHVGAIEALAELLIGSDRSEEALALLERIPETPQTRHLAALARTGPQPEVETKLDGLLSRVKTDEDARQEFLDLLELMGPDDPRTARYRRELTSRLF